MGIALRGYSPSRHRGLEVGPYSSYSSLWDLGLPLTAAAQGECGIMGPLQHTRGNGHLAQGRLSALVYSPWDSAWGRLGVVAVGH